jgi:hypothetical protein
MATSSIRVATSLRSISTSGRVPTTWSSSATASIWSWASTVTVSLTPARSWSTVWIAKPSRANETE